MASPPLSFSHHRLSSSCVVFRRGAHVPHAVGRRGGGLQLCRIVSGTSTVSIKSPSMSPPSFSHSCCVPLMPSCLQSPRALPPHPCAQYFIIPPIIVNATCTTTIIIIHQRCRSVWSMEARCNDDPCHQCFSDSNTCARAPPTRESIVVLSAAPPLLNGRGLTWGN